MKPFLFSLLVLSTCHAASQTLHRHPNNVATIELYHIDHPWIPIKPKGGAKTTKCSGTLMPRMEQTVAT